MTAGGDGFAAVAGGPALHIPVLGRPAVDFLKVRDGGVYIDATFGAGGYSRALLGAAEARVIGIDRDQSAIAGGAVGMFAYDLVRTVEPLGDPPPDPPPPAAHLVARLQEDRGDSRR